MSSFQEWTESLSKKAPIRFELSKVAVAIDNSYATLLQLLYSGYDRVQWCLDSAESCDICKSLAEKINSAGGIDLAHFLGYRKEYMYTTDETGNTVPELDENGEPKFNLTQVVSIYRDAPIYNWSHVGCSCFLLVFKSKDPGDSQVVTREG